MSERAYTARELADYVNEWLREYPELADTPVEVEHDEGLLDPLSISLVQVGNGCVTLIVSGEQEVVS